MRFRSDTQIPLKPTGNQRRIPRRTGYRSAILACQNLFTSWFVSREVRLQ